MTGQTQLGGVVAGGSSTPVVNATGDSTAAAPTAATALPPLEETELEFGNIAVSLRLSAAPAEDCAYACGAAMLFKDAYGREVGRLTLSNVCDSSTMASLLENLGSEKLISARRIGELLAECARAQVRYQATFGNDAEQIVEEYDRRLRLPPPREARVQVYAPDAQGWKPVDAPSKLDFEGMQVVDIDLPISDSASQKTALSAEANRLVQDVPGQGGLSYTGADAGGLFVDIRLFDLVDGAGFELRKTKLYCLFTSNRFVALHDGPVEELSRFISELAQSGDARQTSAGQLFVTLLTRCLLENEKVVSEFERQIEKLQDYLDRNGTLRKRDLRSTVPQLHKGLRYCGRKLDELHASLEVVERAVERHGSPNVFGPLEAEVAREQVTELREFVAKLSAKTTGLFGDLKDLQGAHRDVLSSRDESEQAINAKLATATLPLIAVFSGWTVWTEAPRPVFFALLGITAVAGFVLYRLRDRFK